jgi:hypothetical protein
MRGMWMAGAGMWMACRLEIKTVSFRKNASFYIFNITTDIVKRHKKGPIFGQKHFWKGGRSRLRR